MVYNDDGTFSLTVNGDTGPDYIVQVSTNLTEWADDIYQPFAPAAICLDRQRREQLQPAVLSDSTRALAPAL